ncbi:MAG: cytochrome b/b6 domain-containing protein [Acidimicrobiia bacterium]
MAATTTPPEAGALPAGAPIERFDRVERIAHWVNATLFGIVMLTGSILYIGQLSVLFGNREIVRTLHVYCGLAIPVAFLVAYLPRWGRALRTDFSRINRWSKDDKRWFRTLGRDKTVRLGKFNSGQKLNAAFVVASAVVMVATGSIMKWFEPFPIDVRTGATFVHDWFAFFIWVAVLGHIWFAFADPEALRSMWRGTISTRWAKLHRPRWYEETTGKTDDPTE